MPLPHRILGIAILLIPLQWFPPFPVPGMQLSDLLFLLAAVSLVLSRPSLIELDRRGLGFIVVFLGCATVSALVNQGSYSKLLGHFELGTIAVLSALAATNPHTNRHLRRCLVLAGVLAALTGLVGMGLFYFGFETALLNPSSGDLLPGHYPRIRGTTVRANQLASLLATSGLVLAADPSLLSRCRRCAFAVLAIAFVFTFSRTIPFALLIGALIVVLPARRTGLWVAWAVLLLLCGAGLFVATRYQVDLNPLAPWAIEVDSQPGTRWVNASQALASALDSPWFGLGPGHLPPGGWSAHFTAINIWATLGLGATVAFTVLFALGLRRPRPEDLGLWLALLLLAVDSLHRDVEDMRHLWVILGLLAVLRRSRHD